MADPTGGGDFDGLAKAGGGAGLGVMLTALAAWLRADRQADRNEVTREKAEAARDKRHSELVEALHATTQAKIEAMRAQAEAMASAAKVATVGLEAKLDAIAHAHAELKADVRELGRELRACNGCAVAPIMGPGLKEPR